MFNRIFLLSCIVLLAQSFCGAVADKAVMGYVETAYIGKTGIRMLAKLDTGADTSSVFAEDIQVETSPSGRSWVRFRLTDDEGRVVRFRKKLLRFVNIKLKTDGSIRRPVISLRVCVGGVRKNAIVNLADRSDFDYPLLIGREFLTPGVLVDSSLKRTSENACKVHKTGIAE